MANKTDEKIFDSGCLIRLCLLIGVVIWFYFGIMPDMSEREARHAAAAAEATVEAKIQAQTADLLPKEVLALSYQKIEHAMATKQYGDALGAADLFLSTQENVSGYDSNQARQAQVYLWRTEAMRALNIDPENWERESLKHRAEAELEDMKKSLRPPSLLSHVTSMSVAYSFMSLAFRTQDYNSVFTYSFHFRDAYSRLPKEHRVQYPNIVRQVEWWETEARKALNGQKQGQNSHTLFSKITTEYEDKNYLNVMQSAEEFLASSSITDDKQKEAIIELYSKAFVHWFAQQEDSLGPGEAIHIEQYQKLVVAPEMIEESLALAASGHLPDALDRLIKAQTLQPEIRMNAAQWNSLCWYGGLWGFATEVLSACDQAVNLAASEDAPRFKDSRGLVYAQIGDKARAATDFRAFVQWAQGRREYDATRAQREQWVQELDAGRNPIDVARLSSLRNAYYGDPSEPDK